MKIISLAVGVLAVLLAALLYFQHEQASVEASLAALAKERDTLNRQLRTLDRAVAELKTRDDKSAVVSSGMPRAERIPSAPEPAAAEPQPSPGVTVSAPKGWGKNGSKPSAYVVGIDENQTWGGMPSAYVKSTAAAANDFGGMMQAISAEDYLGKRVRLSGWVKTADANDGGGHLWLRVDGQQTGVSLQFDNMNNRPVKGTSDWQECSVVLEVPPGASALAYGFFVQGAGQMWVSGTKLEPVGPEVPSTNIPLVKKSLPRAPVNLGFYPDPVK